MELSLILKLLVLIAHQVLHVPCLHSGEGLWWFPRGVNALGREEPLNVAVVSSLFDLKLSGELFDSSPSMWSITRKRAELHRAHCAGKGGLHSGALAL